MSRTAVFAFLILSLVAAFCFGAAVLLVLNEAVLGRIGARALAAGLAGGALSGGLAWLWFRAALQ
ncbi:MAG: hypothetical protein HKP30_18420, partial [Myxococcales bacterium]|nr:hypothetical protein [Myxococcales bacterium]